MRHLLVALLAGSALIVGSPSSAVACEHEEEEVTREVMRARKQAAREARRAHREARRDAARAHREAARAQAQAQRDFARAQRDAAQARAEAAELPDMQQKLDKLERKLEKLRQRLERFRVPGRIPMPARGQKVPPSSPIRIDIQPLPDGEVMIDWQVDGGDE